jgi:predicted RNA methylase
MSATATQRRIQDDVLVVLSAGRCEGTRFFLPGTQLDRKLYDRTNEVLTALGGKWNRSAKAHVFSSPCADLIDDAIETASFTRPGDMGWFPTPEDIASHVAAMADIQPGMTVLEPSAGEGALVHEALKLGGRVTAIEIDPNRCEVVNGLFRCVAICDDFMSMNTSQLTQFDRVLMNPPFAKRADIHHVKHALKFLRPGGRLVAIMSAGVAFRDDALARDFRALCDTIEALPDGAFKQSGTMVRTVVVTITKR